jgi:hypothetical protein
VRPPKTSCSAEGAIHCSRFAILECPSFSIPNIPFIEFDMVFQQGIWIEA